MNIPGSLYQHILPSYLLNDGSCSTKEKTNISSNHATLDGDENPGDEPSGSQENKEDKNPEAKETTELENVLESKKPADDPTS